MSIRIVNYSPEYQKGVIACLKRNYPWMSTQSDVFISKWISPILTYHWQNDSLSTFPQNNYGIIILDNDTVVGFLGFIYSTRIWNKTPYRYANASTWAIDDGYRIYMFKAMKMAMKDMDIISDFTACQAVESSMINVFKFKYLDQKIFKFFPFPYIGKSHIILQPIDTIDDIDNSIIKMEFQDHQQYEIKCVKFSLNTSNTTNIYIFYKYEIKHKPYRGTRKTVTILKISDSKFASNFAFEWIWKLLRYEKATSIEIDSRFFGQHEIKYPFYYKIKPTNRLILNHTNAAKPNIDFLYSEVSMLP